MPAARTIANAGGPESKRFDICQTYFATLSTRASRSPAIARRGVLPSARADADRIRPWPTASLAVRVYSVVRVISSADKISRHGRFSARNAKKTCILVNPPPAPLLRQPVYFSKHYTEAAASWVCLVSVDNFGRTRPDRIRKLAACLVAAAHVAVCFYSNTKLLV